MTTTPISATARVTSSPGSRSELVRFVSAEPRGAGASVASLTRPHHLIDVRHRQWMLDVDGVTDRRARVAGGRERHRGVHVRRLEQRQTTTGEVERAAAIAERLDTVRRPRGDEHE